MVYTIIVNFFMFFSALCLSVAPARAQDKEVTEAASTTSPKAEQLGEITNRLNVKIHGRDVLTNAERQDLKKTHNLPAALNNDEARGAMTKRKDAQFYDHSPTLGDPNAPVTIVEYTDLSCLQCMPMLKKADEVRKKYKDKIYYVHVHLPVDLFNATNPAAFYGRIAYMSKKFWEYRERAIEAKESSDKVYSDMLLAIGIDKKEMRDLTLHGARRAYRDLDADSLLSKKMKEDKPPVLYVNGVRVGYKIPIESLEELVRYEIFVRENDLE